MDEQFLTVADIAQRWQLKKKIIYQLKHEIGYHKFKGSIRFNSEDVLAYEKKQKIKKSEPNETTN